jgi:hypothetical protein
MEFVCIWKFLREAGLFGILVPACPIRVSFARAVQIALSHQSRRARRRNRYFMTVFGAATRAQRVGQISSGEKQPKKRFLTDNIQCTYIPQLCRLFKVSHQAFYCIIHQKWKEFCRSYRDRMIATVCFPQNSHALCEKTCTVKCLWLTHCLVANWYAVVLRGWK